MAVKMKVREMRKVLTDQFCFMGDFLWDTADKISGSKIKDSAKSSALKTAMQDSGVYADSVSYYADRDGRVTIEISIIDRPFETDRSRLREIIETVSKRSFSEPDITVGDVKTTITFEERYLYELQSGYCQKPLSAKGFCGDSVCFVASQDGVKTAILSDGMGTGSRAAIDSSLTSSVIEKLICAGFSVSSAIKTVNSAMIMKSTDESISTADTVSVNLYTGTADFYKSGAAISFIRRGNEIFIIRQESLPLGIIRNISPAHSTVELSPGDIILLVSDGVTSEDCGWINDELLSWSTNNMQDLASHICSLAVLRSDKHSRDDITAVALKISRSRQEQDINTITT
jgi:stage II sporulation protein E